MSKYISDCQDIVDEIGFITSYDKKEIILNAFDEDKEEVREYVDLIFSAIESLNDFVEAYSAKYGKDKDSDIDDVLTEALSSGFEHKGRDALYIEELLKKAYEAYKKGKMKFRSFNEDSQRDFWHYVKDKMYKYYEDIKEYYKDGSDKHWIEDIVDDYILETDKHVLGGDALDMVNQFLYYNSDEFEDEEEEEENIEESRRPRGRMLKEYVDEMPIPYLIGQVKYEDGWSPMVVYLNWGDDRYWYEASIIEAGGVMFEELGRSFVVSKVKPGTDKCDPKKVYAVKRHFFDSCEDQGLPVREVKTVRELGRCAPAGRELHSRD